MAALFCRYLVKLGWRVSIAGSGYLVSLGRLQSLAAPRGLTARLAPAAAAVAKNVRRCMVSAPPALVRKRPKLDSRKSKLASIFEFRVSASTPLQIANQL